MIAPYTAAVSLKKNARLQEGFVRTPLNPPSPLPGYSPDSRPSKDPASNEKLYKAHPLGSINVNKKGRVKIQTGEMCLEKCVR